MFGTALAFAVITSASATGTVGTASGFEDNDGNLVHDTLFDWNDFNPTSWTGTAPYRTSTKTTSGWQFKGLEDASATTSDTAFAGGTKQDNNCPTVNGAKAANKDDLKRIYLSSQTVNNHVYLNLAWVRIPQNTTSPSAHVAFEFNKGTTACGGSGGLVQRVAGDMLIVYDFEGGSGDPVLTLRRWVTSGSCEISSDSAPCWGPATNLSAAGFAEAKVNTTATAADTIAPSNETLGLSEFGEAGIDLTSAGVFTAGACAAFGTASGVSRSSGNSGTAQMKDLVGPGSFTLSNCGRVTIIKHTNPAGLDQSFGFTSTLSGTCTSDSTPAAFNLNAGGTDTEDCTNVPTGNYTVTEGAEPTGFALQSLTCVASGGGSGTQDATVAEKANISVTANSVVTCTYLNQQQLGAIRVNKTTIKTGHAALQGATFDVKDSGDNTVATLTTDSNGTDCVSGLAFGDYTVTETAAPTGYQIDNSDPVTATINANGDCTTGAVVKNFTDTPLTDILATATSEATDGTASHIVCKDASDNVVAESASGNTDPASASTTGLLPGTYTCTIVIDP